MYLITMMCSKWACNHADLSRTNLRRKTMKEAPSFPELGAKEHKFLVAQDNTDEE